MFFEHLPRNQKNCVCQCIQVLDQCGIIFLYKMSTGFAIKLLITRYIVLLWNVIHLHFVSWFSSCYSCWWSIKGRNILIIWKVLQLLCLISLKSNEWEVGIYCLFVFARSVILVPQGFTTIRHTCPWWVPSLGWLQKLSRVSQCLKHVTHIHTVWWVAFISFSVLKEHWHNWFSRM